MPAHNNGTINIDKDCLTEGTQRIFLHPFLVAAFGRSRKNWPFPAGRPLLAALVVKGLNDKIED